MSLRTLVDSSSINDILLSRPKASDVAASIGLSRRAGPCFVSAVTIQEMVAFWLGEEMRRVAEVTSGMPVLVFDERAAVAAGRLFASTRPSSLPDSAKKVWHRDCAIIGTALVNSVDVIVTTDGGMRQLAQQAHLHVVP